MRRIAAVLKHNALREGGAGSVLREIFEKSPHAPKTFQQKRKIFLRNTK
jgi:hypothetical protein